MAGAGRTVVQPVVLSDRPTGEAVPYRNVDPIARQYLSQYAYLRGSDALMGAVPSIGLPGAGALGPNWSGVGSDPNVAAPAPPPAGAADGSDGCCG